MSDVATPWFVERYTVARRIWAIKEQRAHDGFTDKRGRVVPAQTWAEWFEWAYGMSLDDYAKAAAEAKHGAQIPADATALCEYRCSDGQDPESWLIVRGIPGETYEQLAAFMKRTFPTVIETRERK